MEQLVKQSRGVLAGAYKGKAAMLTHMVRLPANDMDSGKPVCTRVLADSLVDGYGMYDVDAAPTCPHCLRVWNSEP